MLSCIEHNESVLQKKETSGNGPVKVWYLEKCVQI